jgi:hypothetical protein
MAFFTELFGAVGRQWELHRPCCQAWARRLADCLLGVDHGPPVSYSDAAVLFAVQSGT